MNHMDFWIWRIKHFTPREITATGALLPSVKSILIRRMDRFRTEVGRAVTFLPGGLTTGRHDSPLHPKGLAGDIAFYDQEGVVPIRKFAMIACSVGFRGVGTYWNGTAYSMHLDCGRTFRQWTRWRHHSESVWHEAALIEDPRELEMARR